MQDALPAAKPVPVIPVAPVEQDKSAPSVKSKEKKK
jgi:hypothetical protein